MKLDRLRQEETEMGEILSFASYAKCLKETMKAPYNRQLKLTRLLLDYLIEPDPDNDHYSAYNKEKDLIFVDKVMASNLFTQKENVHAKIQRNCDLELVVNGVKGYFEQAVIPNISPHMEADLVRNMLRMIEADQTIAAQKKAEFKQKAEDIGGFLSSVFLYAVKKNNKAVKANEENDRRIFGANEQYYKSAVDNLFLHKSKENKTIRLIDLYVTPEFREIERYGGLYPDNSIFEYIGHFALSEERNDGNILFVEGDAGVGKTSLVSYLTYHYVEQTAQWNKLFRKKELLCIRLRDIIPSCMQFSSDMIVKDIFAYLGLSSIEEFEARYEDALIVLDGFDELCMVEGISADSQNYIYQIDRAFRDYKVIITTRPQYLNIRALDINSRWIVLRHLSVRQRKRWIEKYIRTGIAEYERYGIEYVSDETNDELDSICDTPMVLYMIVAGGINEEAKHNIWALYHQIFYKELADTEYNSMFRNNEGVYSHGIRKHSNMLYRISAEIAYRMFCSGNKKLFITEREIKGIIDRMNIENAKTKEIMQHCYALCNYWKADDKGAVEFYHNNIRDFFLCEKIYYELNDMYLACETMDDAEQIPYINGRLYDLLRYMKLPQKVVEFLYLRAAYQLDHKNLDDFPVRESVNGYLPHFFSDMLMYGGVSRYERASDENVYSNMVNTLFNVVQIFRHAYEVYMPEGGQIVWWCNRHTFIINEAGILRDHFKQIFITTPLTLDDKLISPAGRACFTNAFFHDLDLRYADFTGSILEHANFTNSIIQSASFEGCDLKGCNFSNADLSNASLLNSDIEECKFTGANLYNTILPDGFRSEDQQEQRAHLKRSYPRVEVE